MQPHVFTQKKLIEEILVADTYQEGLEELVENITSRCVDAPNEATVVNIFDTYLFLFLREHFHLDYFPEKEIAVDTVRSVAKSRVDSKVGALVIEYKQPSKLKTTQDRLRATTQIKEYLEGLYAADEANYVGFITDGVVGKLVEFRQGRYTESAFTPLHAMHLDTLIKSVVLLDKLALNPANLINSFCKPGKSSLVRRMVQVFYNTLCAEPTERTQMLFREWQELFKLAHDDVSKQQAIIERSRALSEAIGTPLANNDEEYKALYSLQTAYAVIVKIIAYKVACNAKFDDKFFEFNAYPAASDAALGQVMQRLEDGAVFREIGIGNLLEGDFFSWYAEVKQWDSEIAECIRQVFELLSRYEDIAIFGSKNESQDLFRELYLHIMPDKVRHSLGEFYTPTWLADHVVEAAIQKLDTPKAWVGLDPCAGSGTFLNVMIRRVLDETEDLDDQTRLQAVIRRVRGIDLNPLAVLAARVNYFITVSSLATRDQYLEIPVYLGDASYVPETIIVQDIAFYQYRIKTLQKDIHVTLPKSMVRNPDFSRTMTDIETYIQAQDASSIQERLLALADDAEAGSGVVRDFVRQLAEDFVELERNNWNGIWARIATNFLSTANLDRADIIVGNPPWIDWKTLPAGYRERIKGLCVSRHLFSGDRITGGINLNICALISNVAAQKWMKPDGVLAFLMPKPLMFQQSYEGFRNLYLDDKRRLYFQEIHDWTKAGHPFQPVQQEFLTYFIAARQQDYRKGIPVVGYAKRSGKSLAAYRTCQSFKEVQDLYDRHQYIAFQSNSGSTAFSYAHTVSQIDAFAHIAGSSAYKGREGIEFYPQELFLLKPIAEQGSHSLLLENYQNQRSKHKIPVHKIVLEKEMLRPLIKGVAIERFHIRPPDYVVPFPYTDDDTRLPMELGTLTRRFPLLAAYLLRYKEIFAAQTNYNDRIIGKRQAEFYALARVGAYSFARNHVAFRDNTKWQAAVVTAKDSWHGLSGPVFQNHAVSISERPDGQEIGYEEAHYICAILNAPVVQMYIRQSSDSRSFKIRPPITIPLFTGSSLQHQLAALSIQAHTQYADDAAMRGIDAELDRLYLGTVG